VGKKGFCSRGKHLKKATVIKQKKAMFVVEYAYISDGQTELVLFNP